MIMSEKKYYLRAHFPILEYIKSLPSQNAKNLIKFGSRGLLLALSELALNLVKNQAVLKLNSQQIKRLKRYQSEILELSKKKTPLNQRKKILLRGGLLSGLLSVILPTLLSSIISATSKK